MTRFLRILSKGACALLLAARAIAQTAPDAPAGAPVNSVEARFDPAARTLSVTAELALPPGGPGEALITLSARARGLRFFAGGSPLPFSRKADAVRARVPAGAKTLALSYDLPLDPPPAALPPTMDNPGAVSPEAVAGPDWAMLMPGSHWHPALEGAGGPWRVRVSAPPGVKAVTQGALDSLDLRPEATVTTWLVRQPVGRLGLCLARYSLEEDRSGPAPVQAFLLERSAALSPVYLQAAARHLSFHADLHGPYPFEKFAVVENPLPTGYGFPSYTLLGSQVIALPFIPATSLRHEVAHSWWGNGVLVDHSQGNWSEGLTTYVADHTAQEEQSPDAARDYRLRALRSFATLAGQGGDFPLSRFTSRDSPASQAVGYGKAMFVFHMLRGFTGDRAFREGLARLYAARLFRPTSWEDIREHFAGLPGFDEAASRTFFRQWTTRAGGPTLSLDAVSARPGPSGGHEVAATVRQSGDPWLVRLVLEVETDRGSASTAFVMDGPEKTVTLEVPGRPIRAVLDPGADCFRLLDPSEVPPTVNSAKASRGLLVVVADGAPAQVRDALPALLAGLGQEKATVVDESVLAGLAEGRDVLVAGLPRVAVPWAGDLLAAMPEADTAFAVAPRPGGGLAAAFQARADADPTAVAAAAGKITHYGGYGALGFKAGANVRRQTARPRSSPMARDF